MPSSAGVRSHGTQCLARLRMPDSPTVEPHSPASERWVRTLASPLLQPSQWVGSGAWVSASLHSRWLMRTAPFSACACYLCMEREVCLDACSIFNRSLYSWVLYIFWFIFLLRSRLTNIFSSPWVVYLTFFFFEIWSCYVAQGGLDLDSRDRPALAFIASRWYYRCVPPISFFCFLLMNKTSNLPTTFFYLCFQCYI